jgi:mRNA interferase MazF
VTARRLWAPDRQEVIWINFNPQSGREMRSLHPLLVLSPRAFNERTGIVIGLPMTTAAFNRNNPFAVELSGPQGVRSFVLTHQPKSFYWRARNARQHAWKKIPDDVFTACCSALNQIIDIGT